MNRRDFLATSAKLTALAVLPMNIVEVAAAKESDTFTFAFISDAHLQHIKGTRFVQNWDKGLKMAVAQCNLLDPKPDFIIFGGDLAQLGKKEELDHGAEILSALHAPVKMMLGEHDYYLDLGETWQKMFGDPYYSFDHKGVHFVVLNSILVDEAWVNRWPTPMDRMQTMAGLDDPNGSPFMVGSRQREWLKKDLARYSDDTPIVIFSHSPLQKIYKGWNFWTEDCEEIYKIVKRFQKVNVIYGHVHQIQYNKIGNIAFNSVMSTAWPWPYPDSYAKAKRVVPKMTIKMNRADPFFERDATGWQFIDVHSGRVDVNYILPNNKNRTVRYNFKKNRPEDKDFQNCPQPPQIHY